MLTFRGPTIKDKIEQYDNRSRGFDYIRIGLSLAVAFWHSFFLTANVWAKDTPFGVPVALILPSFFALSGFLISGSLVRTKDIREFIVLRVVRIMPALTVEVLLSAFALGPLFTTLPLASYFTHPLFFAYLENIYGNIHFLLPGVFQHNLKTAVNLSLWTIPSELMCYLAIILLWIVGAVPRRRTVLLMLVVVTHGVLLVRNISSGHLIDTRLNALPGNIIILCFLYAVILYSYKDRIVLDKRLAAAALVGCTMLLHSSIGSYFVPPLVSYLTVFLGLTNPPKIPVLMSADYSYGIYLYAAPFQQASVALFPDHRIWWFNLLTTIVPICLLAAFSWHVVEKPILSHRKLIIQVINRLTDPLMTWLRWTARRSVGRNG